MVEGRKEGRQTSLSRSGRSREIWTISQTAAANDGVHASRRPAHCRLRRVPLALRQTGHSRSAPGVLGDRSAAAGRTRKRRVFELPAPGSSDARIGVPMHRCTRSGRAFSSLAGALRASAQTTAFIGGAGARDYPAPGDGSSKRSTQPARQAGASSGSANHRVSRQILPSRNSRIATTKIRLL